MKSVYSEDDGAEGAWDVVVVGGGPAGSMAAGTAARAGLRVLLLDRAQFPRDKVCGDAISRKAVEILERIGLAEKVHAAGALGSYGVSIFSTRGDHLEITFEDDLQRAVPPSFVCERRHFDGVLLDWAKDGGVTVRQGVEVGRLLRAQERVTGVRIRGANGEGHELTAPLVIGADGANSAVARAVGVDARDDRHFCAGLRCYYEGIGGFHEHHHLEVHFLDGVLPGYFWMFPLPDGRANIGVGMLSRAVKQGDVRLRALLQRCVAHPSLRDRFANARPLGAPKGWGLPLGSKPRKMSGEGWMLTGDAASLIDPFAGEGIGNAMFSGIAAGQWAVQAAASRDYSAAFLSGYEREVLRALRSELRLSYYMQRLGSRQWLLDAVVGRVARSPELTRAVTLMMDDERSRLKLVSPLFYLKLLFT